MSEQLEEFVPESMRKPQRRPLHPARPQTRHIGAKVLFGLGAAMLFYFWLWFPFMVESSDPNTLRRAMTSEETSTRLIGVVVGLGFMIVGAILSLRGRAR